MIYILIGIFIALHFLLGYLVVVNFQPGSVIHFVFANYDEYVHLFSSVLITTMAYFILSHKRFQKKHARIIASLYMLALIILTELIQHNLSYRSVEISDLSFGILGILIAQIIMYFIHKKYKT